jgi:diguanylate cyclase (GGDEF)-like protein
VAGVTLVGIAISVGVAMLLQDRSEQEHEVQFTQEATTLATAAHVGTGATFGRINDLTSFLSVAGVPTQNSFQRYLREADLLGQTWLEGVAFVEPVAHEDLAAFVARERRQSGQRVKLRLRDENADEHWLISRTLAPDMDQIGVDVKDIPGFEAVVAAVDLESEPLYLQLTQAQADTYNELVGATDPVGSGSDTLAGVIPVREGGSGARLGWLLVELRPNAIVRTGSTTAAHARLRLLSNAIPGQDILIPLTSDAPYEEEHHGFTQEFSTSGMTWELAISSDEHVGLGGTAVMVLVLGILASLSTGLLLALQRKAHSVGDQLSRSEHDRRIDPLTGLPNRLGLAEAIDEALQDQKTTAVLFCDIDRFKVINDSLGHQAGDELLCLVAQRLQSSTRSDDVVGRFGGDEFVVVCRHLEKAAEAEHVAERILARIAPPVKIAGTRVEVGASVGIALSGPDERRTRDEMLRDADAAMYTAKKMRSGHRLFDAALRRKALDRLSIESALRTTARDGLHRVKYQPIVATGSHRLVALEALARFDHPVLAAAGPERVIPIAEEIGLVRTLGDRVMTAACQQLATWNQMRLDAAPLQVTMNLAESQLRDPELVSKVQQAVLGSGIAPRQLVLELPESAVTQDLNRSMVLLGELAEIGVELAIDDFGSGHSALSDIVRLTTVSELKIDRSLVSGSAASSVRSLLISAISEIAKGLDARLVAVGVETQEQLARISSAGVDRAQGFLFSDPLLPEELTEIITDATNPIRPRLHSESTHAALPAIRP